MHLKFSKETFSRQDLPNLLINIWSHSRPGYRSKPILKIYCNLCIECAREKWSGKYLGFDFVINNLKQNKKKIYDFGRISSAETNIIYRIIQKHE